MHLMGNRERDVVVGVGSADTHGSPPPPRRTHLHVMLVLLILTTKKQRCDRQMTLPLVFFEKKKKNNVYCSEKLWVISPAHLQVLRLS